MMLDVTRALAVLSFMFIDGNNINEIISTPIYERQHNK